MVFSLYNFVFVELKLFNAVMLCDLGLCEMKKLIEQAAETRVKYLWTAVGN